MSEEVLPSRTGGWYLAQWPQLAWLETAVKLAAIGVGVYAFAQAVAGGVSSFPAGLRLAQWVVLAVLSLGLLAAIFDRLREREVVAMAFVILNNLGHWGMAAALAFTPRLGDLLAAFAALMLAGDLVKLVFIKLRRFSVRAVPPALLYGLTGLYALGYAVILLLEFLAA